jgi:hypothetical protein
MAWKSGVNSPVGYPVPGNVDATALVPVGTVAKFYDDTQGEGEFIYLPGVASTAAGDCVDYDLVPGGQATVRHTNATASNSGRPVAFATAATIAATFGWYQIGGVAIINVAAGMAIGNLFSTATAGVLDDGADAGDQILGARCSSAIGTPAANKSYATLNRPHVQGQIT